MPSASLQTIAERTLFAVAATGEKRTFRLAIGRPYRVDAVSWACPVALDGLHDRLHDIAGTDAWQALTLALNPTRQLLGYFVEDGGRLYWEEGGEALRLADLFPWLPFDTTA